LAGWGLYRNDRLEQVTLLMKAVHQGRELSPAELEGYRESINAWLAKKAKEISTLRPPVKVPFAKEVKDNYQFQLVGEEDLQDRSCYVIGFAPKQVTAAYDPARGTAWVQGRAWVDKNAYEVVKLIYSYVKPRQEVTSSYVEIFYKEVAPGFWATVSFIRKLEGRYLFFKMKEEEVQRFRDFKLGSGFVHKSK
jgi:hypothetical protein